MPCKLSDEEVAELMTIARQDPARLADAIRERLNPSLGSKVQEIWSAGLLSNPATHLVNGMSNLTFQGMRAAERALSVAMQAGLSRVSKVQRDRYTGELGAAAAGARASVVPALKQLGEDLRDIVTLAPEKMDPDVLTSGGQVESRVGKVGGKTGRAVRSTFRLLEAGDQLFKNFAGAQELYAQAYREAYASGLRGDAIPPRMEEITRRVLDANDNSPVAKRIREAVRRERLNSTFQDEMGPLGQRGLRLINWELGGFRPLRFLSPFNRTPFNVTKEALKRTPLGYLDTLRKYRAWRNRGVTPEQMQKRMFDTGELPPMLGDVTDSAAKATLGTVVMGMVLALTDSGAFDDDAIGITGGGPTDPKEKENLLSTGWQPYSVRVGDTYVSYRRLAPISQVVGMAADYAEARTEEARGEQAMKLHETITTNVLDQSFLSGLQAGLGALAEPERKFSTWVRQFLGSMVPAGVAAMVPAVDPVQREVDPYGTRGGVPEPILARIPGASSMLPEKSDPRTGEAMPRTSGGLNPFRVSTRGTTSDTELQREFDRVGWVPTRPKRSVTVPRTGGQKAELTDAEYERLRDADTKAAERVRRMMRTSTYRKAADTDEEAAGTGRKSKESLLRDTYTRARSETLARLQPAITRRWFAERRKAQGTRTAAR